MAAVVSARPMLPPSAPELLNGDARPYFLWWVLSPLSIEELTAYRDELAERMRRVAVPGGDRGRE